jgi:hypothetical protein
MSSNQLNKKRQLDKIFLSDAIISLVLGSLSLLTPHDVIKKLNSGSYNHSAHEALRLYGCLRIAVGWMLFHLRSVDDGRFRRSVCEGLAICYALQSLAVLRAQFTVHGNWIHLSGLCFLLIFSFIYFKFRFSKGGDMIKIYELPTSARSIR